MQENVHHILYVHTGGERPGGAWLGPRADVEFNPNRVDIITWAVVERQKQREILSRRYYLYDDYVKFSAYLTNS